MKKLKTLNETRLLHAGASTQLILTQYISTIKCLLIIDPTGVLLASVAEPIRKYLRERPDTIRSIVASFVDEESELVEEGDAQDNAPIVLENDDAPDWEDPNWEPEPIDAGPSGLQITASGAFLTSNHRLSKRRSQRPHLDAR